MTFCSERRSLFRQRSRRFSQAVRDFRSGREDFRVLGRCFRLDWNCFTPPGQVCIRLMRPFRVLVHRLSRRMHVFTLPVLFFSDSLPRLS